MENQEQTHPLKGILNMIFIALVAIALMTWIEYYNMFNSSLNSKQFEYKVEYLQDEAIKKGLTKAGWDGWQIVSSRRASSYEQFGYEVIYMREK